MGRPMGMGKLGGADLIFKRKFRWTFEVTFCGGDVPADFVKLASRPNLSIEETEINFLNGKTFLPGKGTWETITVTYYDVATRANLPLYNWIATVYDFTTPDTLHQGNAYNGEGVLTLYSGCGDPLETWTLSNMWPQAINFGELDYSSSEEVTIELTLRYGQVRYQSICPSGTVTPCECPPCR